MRLKALTYNIHKGFNIFNRSFIIEDIKVALEKTNADIVFLQEIVGSNQKEQKKREEWIERQYEFLADTLWSEYRYEKNAITDFHDHGNAILSKYPIKSHYNLDLSTNSFEHRGLLHCTIETPAGEMELMCTHINLLHRSRAKQVRMINQYLDSINSKNPLILAGDFNDWGEKLDSIIPLENASKLVNGKNLKTFPSFMPLLKLDRIYTQNIQTKSVETMNETHWKFLSDHIPLLWTGSFNEN